MNSRLQLVLGVWMFSLSSFLSAAEASKLQTKAEKTDFVETGRYEETEDLCHAFQKRYPEKVRCFAFGKSPEGRDLWALSIGSAKAFLKTGTTKPVVAFQGGIHAGEIDGKDAGFWLVRDILEGRILSGALEEVTLLFVPIFNVDGHERFELNTRPNQIGPKEKGFRVTAQNFNLNRDYLKADAEEMRAMLTLLKEWDPILYIDLHVTDGAKFQHDIAVLIEPSNAGPENLRSSSRQLSDTVMKDLKAAGHLPLATYPSFLTEDEPTSGMNHKPARPSFSNGYWAYRNRLAVLVETHSWRPYKHRVESTYETLKSLIAQAQVKGKDWQKTAKAADLESSKLIGENFPLSYESTKKSHTIDFLGYAYTRTPSKISGQLMTRYDETKPEVWRMPFFPEVEPKALTKVPEFIVIPSAYRFVFEPKLKLHGIAFEELTKPWTGKADVFRAKPLSTFKGPSESHQRLEYDGAWTQDNVTLPKGSLRISLRQPLARLTMMMLEPMSPDSLMAWGFLNQIFERKEYMEAYVAEEVAEEMLKDPRIKAEFESRLKDPEFAKNPEKRLDFFAEKHPSYDRNFLRYPLVKVYR